MAYAFDKHTNFAYSTVATAPSPALSGTSLVVQTGDGAKFPAVPFNAVVWPAGQAPTQSNAEIVRVTTVAVDTLTITRTQESSNNRAIAVGDQIAAAITVKTMTDAEQALAKGVNPGGRLTLTSATPVTTSDVTAATTLYYTPYLNNILPLYNVTSAAWVLQTFSEISIAVPASTSQMYDVFVFDNSGTPALELLAWTNDTTRATALVRQDGKWCKTGALDRLYLGSFRTTGVSGQTEDSVAKRYVWNMYNRVRRTLARTESTTSWTYSGNYRQANANTANQVEVVVGLNEIPVSLNAVSIAANSVASTAVSTFVVVGIGVDSTSASSGAYSVGKPAYNTVATVPDTSTITGQYYVAAGRHYFAWLEAAIVNNGGTVTFYKFEPFQGDLNAGLSGWVEA